MQVDGFNTNAVPEDEMAVFDEHLDEILELGLEIEVIYWALMAMKKNPELKPSEAFILGLTEWIK